MLRLKRTIGDAIVLLDDSLSARMTLTGVNDRQVTFRINEGSTERIVTLALGARLTFIVGDKTVQVALEATRGRAANLGIGAPSTVSIVRAELIGGDLNAIQNQSQRTAPGRGRS